MEDVVVLLTVLCTVFLSSTIVLAAFMLSRVLNCKKGRYSGPSRSSVIHMDKIFFASDDLIWAMSMDQSTNMDSMLRPNNRRNVHVKRFQKIGMPNIKGLGAKTSGPERSQYTIMSSTISLDHKGTKQNIAYLKGRRPVYCIFTTSSQMKVHNLKKKSQYLKELRNLAHENINMFWGVFSEPYRQGFLFDFAKRGSLQDVLLQTENKVVLDWTFKQALITDLVNGMKFLHRSALRCHGNLRSTKCLIDHRWVLKISGFGLNPLMENVSIDDAPSSWLWTAPEHLKDTNMAATPKGDVYSFGIILQEVITENYPFGTVCLEPQEILTRVMKPPPFCRPSVSNSLAPPPFINMMKECWSENPDRRPSFEDIARRMRHLNKGRKPNFIDSILKKLEKYSFSLEEIVEDRTLKLEEEKKKTEQLLCRMLPPSVAEDLKAGNSVHPEHYDQVTIFFSDIVGFTTISAASTPMQIVNLLNMLYTRFDEIIGHHDVYKVETIGDAYMCVSGLPKRNGINHAGEIATMALELLSTIAEMKVPHLPLVPLKLRIGCHTGHCAAGVVGLTMPRYCLFGDTVNTANRMESHSRAERIHLSKSTKVLLDELGGYHIESRGEVNIKSKGRMETFWLIGKDGYDKPLPQFVDDEGDELDSHGLESLLKEEELQQLLHGVSKNASPKHSRVEQQTIISADYNGSSPRLSVPIVSVMPNVRACQFGHTNERTRSVDSLPIEKFNNVHRVVILPASQKTPPSKSDSTSSVDTSTITSHTHLT